MKNLFMNQYVTERRKINKTKMLYQTVDLIPLIGLQVGEKNGRDVLSTKKKNRVNQIKNNETREKPPQLAPISSTTFEAGSPPEAIVSNLGLVDNPLLFTIFSDNALTQKRCLKSVLENSGRISFLTKPIPNVVNDSGAGYAGLGRGI